MKTIYEAPELKVLDTAVDVITASIPVRSPIQDGGDQSQAEDGYSWDSIF